MAIDRIVVDSGPTPFEAICVDKDNKIVDVSDATTQNIIFKKPDDVSIEVVGTFTTDGTDGKIRASLTALNNDLVGEWQYQAKAITPSGTYYSDPIRFIAVANLT